MKYFLALPVAFLILGGIAMLFTAADKTQSQPHETSYYMVSDAQAISSSGDDLVSFLPPLAAAKGSGVAVGMLDQDLDNNGNLDGTADPFVGRVGFSPSLVAANKSRIAVGVLDNDLDHDGNPDGLVDPLGVVEVLLFLAALVSGSLLLALCEPPKLYSVWLPVLERPS